jgi:hypothetical protein
MSESNFEITTVRVAHAITVCGEVEFFMQSASGYEFILSPDPRFLFIKNPRKPNFPPTVVPLSNVVYMTVVSFNSEDKKKTEAKKK